MDSNNLLSTKSSPAPINFAIALTELIMDILALIPNIYFIFILWKRQDLHNNLRVLLASFSCSLILIALTRLPTQLNYIFTGVLYIDSFNLLVYGHEIAVMFFRTVIVPLTFERVLATIFSKNYEQQKSPKIGICAVILTLLVSIAIGIYIGSELNNSSIRNGVITFRGSYYGLYHIIDVSLRLIIWIICFAIFVLILRYNQRCYAFSRLPNKHTLVQRYQFAENVRSSKLLLAIGIIIFVCNLHFDFVMLRIAYNKDYFNVEYSQSFDFVLALALNAIPIAAISFHSSMLEAFKSHLKQLTNLCTLKKTNNSISDEPQNNINNSINHLPINSILPFPPNESTKIVGRLKNYKSPRALLTGQKLIIGREEEQRVYFDELRKSWNVPI
ncbi:hypothetical protein ACQ4LE_003801, partial [Meloidogyne hapla]